MTRSPGFIGLHEEFGACPESEFGDGMHDGALTPLDMYGHVTHVSATTAGSKACGVNLLDFSRGTAWGVAPKAWITIYKACIRLSCPGSSITAAIRRGERRHGDSFALARPEMALKLARAWDQGQ
jgi:hypothetical protein